MRVLVVDQDSEMLAGIARAFELDVATSKATCVDLLRANPFDVIVACERLEDGSGLELLSQVAKRWPNVVRILAIEPSRRALLRGKLGPFKLFDMLAYPLEESQLEAALERASAEAEANAEDEAPPEKARHVPATPPARTLPIPSATRPRTAQAPPSSAPQAPRVSAHPARAPLAQSRSPVPPRGSSRFVPLGAPNEQNYRILPHDYGDDAPLASRAQRLRENPKPPTIPEKAAAFATEAIAAVQAAVSRYMKPQPAPPRVTPPTPPPRKKR